MGTTHGRLPRAGTDPIASGGAALSLIAVALNQPMRAETIVLVLDRRRRGRAVVVVDGTGHPDDVLGVVECLAAADGGGGGTAFVVATVRPGLAVDTGDRTDADRWLEMSELAERVGSEVVEWFVIDRGVRCPRDLLGEPPRW